MASQVPGRALRTNIYGTRVDRATAALPQTTTGTLFTITGGRIILTTLVGEVTTAIQAQANALQLLHVATVGSSTSNLSASFESNGLAVGVLIGIPGTIGGTAVFSGGTTVQSNELLMQPGNIRLSAAASNTGSVRWTLTYFALDDGATVVAA